MKIVVTTILVNSVANWVLSIFCPLVGAKNKNCWCGNKKYLCFFVDGELCSTLKATRIKYTFIKELSYVLFLFVL